MNRNAIIIAVIALVAIGAALVYAASGTPAGQGPTATSTIATTTTTAATTTTSGAPVVGAGAHCGGFIANAPVCASGYHCQLNTIADTGGTCVADPIRPYASGISGSVMLGPTCPVEQNPPQPQCADKPYATTIEVMRAGSSSIVATAQSGADGTFTLSVPPGSYTVTAEGGQTLPRCDSVSVTVTLTYYATANISCDTGIR